MESLVRIFWDVARKAYRRLPVSRDTAFKVRNKIFSILGDKASSLPGYYDWKNRAAAAAQTPSAPAPEIWKNYYAGDSRPAFLFISHDVGGGTEQHVVFLKNKLEKEGFRVLALRHAEMSCGKKSGRVYIHGFAPDAIQHMGFDLGREKNEMVALLKGANIKHIHVHHTLHMPEGILAFIKELSQELQVAYDYTAHDYLSICPRFTLYQDGTGSYCGEPDIKGCNACLATYGSEYGKYVDMKAWREKYADFFSAARRVFTPDDDVTNRLKRYFPAAKIETRPHEEPNAPLEILGTKRESGEPLRVAILGAIAPHKGASIIFQCAEQALLQNQNIHFTVIGYTSEDWRRKPLSNMTITGAYTNDELHRWLKEGKFHLAFFPAIWPETYSYTLSIALRYGIHPVSFDLGAIARRIKASNFGTVLGYDYFCQPRRINEALLTLSPKTPPADLMQTQFTRYGSYIKDYYGLTGAL